LDEIETIPNDQRFERTSTVPLRKSSSRSIVFYNDNKNKTFVQKITPLTATVMPCGSKGFRIFMQFNIDSSQPHINGSFPSYYVNNKQMDGRTGILTILFWNGQLVKPSQPKARSNGNASVSSASTHTLLQL
jgi:hypothetical protein